MESTPLTSVLLAACLATVGCAGRSPQLVQLVQPNDQYASCQQIMIEVQANNQKIEALARDEGWKVTQNVVAGVAGFVVPVLWFGMDWQGTASKEAQALSQRNQYLGSLAAERCKRQSPSPAVANDLRNQQPELHTGSLGTAK